jgi:hypothetical protein
MTVIKFNTKEHKLAIDTDLPFIELLYEDVMTIKDNGSYYEILQRQEDGRNAPILRLPIVSTVIIFKHK